MGNLRKGNGKHALNGDHTPVSAKLKREAYEEKLAELHFELVKMQ